METSFITLTKIYILQQATYILQQKFLEING